MKYKFFIGRSIFIKNILLIKDKNITFLVYDQYLLMLGHIDTPQYPFKVLLYIRRNYEIQIYNQFYL